MNKVLKFEDYLRADRYREQVILPLLDRNPIYDSIRYENEAIAFLHYNLYIYAFLSYVPNGEHTALPTVEDSFNNIRTNSRVSTGEWVVNEFYNLKKEEALSIYPLIYTKRKKDGWFNNLKEVIIEKSKIDNNLK